MNVPSPESLLDALKLLALRITSEIDNGISKGEIRPLNKLYQRWKIDKFQYTEQGVTEPSAHTITDVIKIWHNTSDRIQESIKQSDEYMCALDFISECVKEEEKRFSFLEDFISMLISRRLNDPKFSDSELYVLIINFIKEINGKPLRYGVNVELNGVVILADDVNFAVNDTEILLRKTRIEDLEKEISSYDSTVSPFYGGTSAILDIAFFGRSAREIQIKVTQAVAILRLFKVGSVKYNSYCMRSEFVTDFLGRGTLNAGESEKAMEKSVIRDKDIQQLVKFWEMMFNRLPLNFYDFGEQSLDYRVISYKRYCDALLQNGVIERRIASAVMGLEGLFLRSSEKQELSYRLKMRIAKLLSFLGYEPYLVRDIVNKAYEVRSNFVHGSHLLDKDKKNLENRFGDIRFSFLLSLLDFLRASIIVMILLKKTKDKLISLIDDALVNRASETELVSMLDEIKEFVKTD